MQSLAEVLAAIPDKILLTEKAVEPHGDSWTGGIALERLSPDATAYQLPPFQPLRQPTFQLDSPRQFTEVNGMKQAIRFAVAALCLSLISAASAVAQDQYTEGGVTRVTLVQILPGHFNAFMEDLKNNLKPIWEAQKKAGLIQDYGLFLNVTKANADDWDIGFSISYKNFAALDGLAQKVLDLRMKQYGDKSKEQQVIDKRIQNARVVTSVLTREITLK
jgi:hypothetical protein